MFEASSTLWRILELVRSMLLLMLCMYHLYITSAILLPATATGHCGIGRELCTAGSNVESVESTAGALENVANLRLPDR
jgi:hypothetical protein